MSESDAASTELEGAQKAVLLLLSLDEATATPIIAELDEDELRRLREVAADMKMVPNTALSQVYGDFVEASNEAVAVPRGGVSYLHRLTAQAHGEEQGNAIFGELPPSAMDRVSAADPMALASILEGEHPQLIAAIASQLEAPKAAALLQQLPEEARVSVIERLGTMTEVPAPLLEEIASVLSAELPEPEPEGVVTIDGLGQSAALVRKLGKELAEEVLNTIDGSNTELAAEIRKAMYTFEELSALDARGMRSLLESVPAEQLTLALKTASEPLKNAVFDSMSKRAAERIKEDMEIMGGVKLSDVEEAQQEIVQIALRLDAEGTISLNSDDAEDVA